MSTTSVTKPESTTTAGTLIEHAAPIAKQVADLGVEGSPQDADQLRSRFEELFRGFESRAIRAGYTESEASAAKYALAAVVDETILLSEHPAKEAWLGRPLQMAFFDDFNAGEEFYNKLDMVRTQRTPHAADVLEVFHLALAMGFKGKYGDARGSERRKVLMDALGNEISQVRGLGPDSPLSPSGLPPEAGVTPVRILGSGPLWMVPLAVIVLLLLGVIAMGILDDHALAAIPGEGGQAASGGDAPAGAKP